MYHEQPTNNLVIESIYAFHNSNKPGKLDPKQVLFHSRRNTTLSLSLSLAHRSKSRVLLFFGED